MPIYEYRCQQCGKRTSRLVLSIGNPPQQSCGHCQSPDMERLMSRFASPKSEEARLEALADPSHLSGLDENDPQSMARLPTRSPATTSPTAAPTTIWVNGSMVYRLFRMAR